MNMSIAEEIKALEATLARLKAEQESERPVKWQPKGGEWYTGGGGEVVKVRVSWSSKEFGTVRQTKEQAERAAVEMRRFNRLLALRDELCGDEVVSLNWLSNDRKYYVYFSHKQDRLNGWNVTSDGTCESITPYFTTLESAQRACDMLNSGEVEL